MNYDVLWLQVVGWDFVDLSLLEADTKPPLWFNSSLQKGASQKETS